MGGSDTIGVQDRGYPSFRFQRGEGDEAEETIDGNGCWSDPEAGTAGQSQDGSASPENIRVTNGFFLTVTDTFPLLLAIAWRFAQLLA